MIGGLAPPIIRKVGSRMANYNPKESFETLKKRVSETVAEAVAPTPL